MLVDKLIDDLRRQVDPDVQDSIFALAFKSIKQVLLDARNNRVSSAKVQFIPLAIGLTVIDALLTHSSVGEKMIDKFD